MNALLNDPGHFASQSEASPGGIAPQLQPFNLTKRGTTSLLNDGCGHAYGFQHDHGHFVRLMDAFPRVDAPHDHVRLLTKNSRKKIKQWPFLAPVKIFSYSKFPH
jgi:hypothetical protein